MGLGRVMGRTPWCAVLLAAGWLATGCGTIDTLEDVEPNDTKPGVYVEWPVGQCDPDYSELRSPVLLVGQVGGDDDPVDHFAIVSKSGPYSYSDPTEGYPVQIDGMTANIETCAIRTTSDDWECASGDSATGEIELEKGETLIFRVTSTDDTKRRYQVKLRCPL
jgi:hypothetical protein